MRAAIKTALIVQYSIAFVCIALLAIEFGARKIVYGQFGFPGRQTELILDRWAAFVNHPNYNANGVRINAQGFRRDTNVSLLKPVDTIRIFSSADRSPMVEKLYIQRSTSIGNSSIIVKQSIGTWKPD